ncbi:MAG: rRNA maturation RNase YbeY [Thermodesulfovibrio sp.]|nr:rRNA maturation RNase YbeY [Thermodesulfovibrio sp.]MCX7723688.1 rRNA maturation RNase YbeY [Thermodesulfovibrio sp.]MDW7972221.1 rRNA maturation RNase YbeY [Thermodesulfovibrio sp.]
MKISVDIINRQRKIKVSSRRLISRVRKILGLLYEIRDKNFLKIINKNQALSVSVILVGDKKIKELNFKYRNKRSITDILSFSYLENEPSGSMFLGELIINPKKVLNQAKSYNEKFSKELDRILVHGILHLIGYDHENVSISKTKKMRKLEEKILSNL